MQSPGRSGFVARALWSIGCMLFQPNMNIDNLKTMKTRMNIPVIAALSCVLAISAPAAARPGAEREVRIDQENFAKLSPEQQEGALALKGRLEEMMAIDRSTLDRAERAELRSEWKALKQDMNAYNAGGTVIYLSTAGIIIILLLLIILL